MATRSLPTLSPRAARSWWGGLPRRDRGVYALFALWLLTMIALPIAGWMLGDDALPVSITIAVGAQIVAVVVALISRWGVVRTLATGAIVVVLAWAFEFVGHMTDMPFGAYAYTDRLQPQIGGVPVLIPLAWLMMLPPAWAIAHVITRRYTGLRGRVAFIGTSALALTAWDLFLDPQMVGWRLWLWDDPSGFTYFGIPLINFAGWLLAGVTITAAASVVIRRETLPLTPLITVYVLTWLLMTGGLALFWGLPGPAIGGFLAMGAMLLWTWRAGEAWRAARESR